MCGGAHVRNTGEIGLFKISSEGSIGSGLRRIEALTGRGARSYFNEIEHEIKEAASVLKTDPTHLASRIGALNRSLKEKDKEIMELKARLSRSASVNILEQAVDCNGTKVLTATVQSPDSNNLRETAERLKDKLGSAVVLLGAIIDERVALVCFVSKDLVERGLNAGKIVGAAARVTGGGGGGRPDMAQAGGKDVDQLSNALDTARNMILESLA